jgi:hypothetical protein
MLSGINCLKKVLEWLKDTTMKANFDFDFDLHNEPSFNCFSTVILLLSCISCFLELPF